MLLVALMFAACGGGGEGEETAPEEALIQAAHPVCGELGAAVLAYLDSGETGQPEIEQAYASTRASILAAPDESQDELSRATASDAISQCDTDRFAEEEAAAAEAQEQAAEEERAERDAEAQAERLEEDARFAAACSDRGGYVSEGGVSCLVDYPGWPAQLVPLSLDGSFNSDQAELSRQNCELAAQVAASGAASGLPWREQPQYYETTGVCTPGTP